MLKNVIHLDEDKLLIFGFLPHEYISACSLSISHSFLYLYHSKLIPLGSSFKMYSIFKQFSLSKFMHCAHGFAI